MYTRFHRKRRYVVYTFIDNDWNKQFKTYTLEYFKNTIDYFIQDSRLILNDVDFVYNSKVLDFVSNETSDFIPQLYLTETTQFKRILVEIRKKKHSRSQESHKKIYSINRDDLFSYYISYPESLTSISDFDLLERYQIFLSLSLMLYCTNCFIHTHKQFGVPINILEILRCDLTCIWLITKDTSKLCESTKLWFINQQPKDHISCPSDYMLNKLGHNKDNYITGYKSCQKPILLLIFKDHCML